MAILPYMKQLPKDYYAKNYAPTVVPTPAPTPIVPSIPPLPAPGPTDPTNEGGVWIGTVYPTNPGEGWLFFNENNNTLYIYVDGKWEQVTAPSPGGIPEAPTDGGTYARRNKAWLSTYDGVAY